MLIFVFYALNWSANSKVPRDPWTMVCCLYVGICFGVVPHHMSDDGHGHFAVAHEASQN